MAEKPLSALIILPSVVLCTMWLQPAFCQQPEIPDCHFGTPESGPRTIRGVEACGNCHSRSPDSAQTLATSNSPRIRQDEAIIWFEDDKHRQAYEVLQNDQSREMARILGIVDPETQESLVHRDVRCLACHSSGPLGHPDVQGYLLPSQTVSEKRYNLGVSCEGCHGPAGSGGSGVPGWIAAHDLESESTNWKQLSPEEKFDRFGFWDVGDSRTQARICLSCHVGNVEQGKVLTHEMYAAGHPPLPGFEINTFIHQQPRHWRYLEDKPAEVREELSARRSEAFDPMALYRTEALFVASLESVAATMNLAADLIDSGVECPTEKPTWPELGSFSCFACHHELKRDSWRQSRPLTPTPGRPTLHEWPLAVAEVAAEFSGHGDEFRAAVANVYTTLDRQPFGQPADVLKACRQIAKAAEIWAVDMQRRGVAAGPDGERLLGLIARKGAEHAHDYDAARQLVWAYERVLHDVNRHRNKDSAAETDPNKRPSWSGWLADRETLSRREAILKSLESEFVLDLRLGGEVSETFRDEPVPRLRVEVDLAVSLQRAAEYDVETVRSAFQNLKEMSDQANNR